MSNTLCISTAQGRGMRWKIGGLGGTDLLKTTAEKAENVDTYPEQTMTTDRVGRGRVKGKG